MRRLLLSLLIFFPIAGLAFPNPVGHSYRSIRAYTIPFTDVAPTSPAVSSEGVAFFAVERASSQSVLFANDTISTVGANVLAVGANGVEIPGSEFTNFALNSGTHPKVAEATASIGLTTSASAWTVGAGNSTIAAGTAVTTGLPCNALPPRTRCNFTVTSAGTILITTPAGVTHVQVESPAPYTTLIPIVTAGTAATLSRQSFSIDVLRVFAFSSWCLSTTWTPFSNWNVTPQTGANSILSTVGGGGANAIYIQHSTPFFSVQVSDSVGNVHSSTFSHDLGANQTTHRFTLCDANGVDQFFIDDVEVGAASWGGPSSFPRSALTTQLRPGGENATFTSANGSLKNVMVYVGTSYFTGM